MIERGLYIIKDPQPLDLNKTLKWSWCEAGELLASFSKRREFNEKTLMEILVKHTVSSLLSSHCSGQNHFLLTLLFMLFRSNITHTQQEPPPLLQRPPPASTRSSTCRTEEGASNSRCGRSRLWPFWVKAPLAHGGFTPMTETRHFLTGPHV